MDWTARPVPRIECVITATAYELATTATALVDRSARAKFLVTGAGAGEFLEGQVTNAVEQLPPGEGRYAAFLNPKGKLRCDLRVLRFEDGFWLDAESYAKEVVEWVVRSFSVGLDVRMQDLTPEKALLSLIGPGARELLDAPEHSHVKGEHGVYVATDLGVDVICDAADADGVRAALGVEEVPFEIAECLRIESGRPRMMLDMDGETIPQEAGLNERAVDFEKGCYVGQETVARLHYRGKPNRHLRGLRLSEPVERGEAIVLGEKEVGKVGSTCVSPRFGPIALALVRREAGPGDTVAVCGAPAEVVDLPFR
jgi:tRNA-modifying protein YgfZ